MHANAKFRTTPRSILIASALCIAPIVACSAGGGEVNGGGVGSGGGNGSDGGVGTSDYGGGGDGGTSTGEGGTTPKGDGGTTGGKTDVTAIFTVVFENHDYNEIVGNTSDAPFFNSLIDSYGLATNYMDSGTHPSLPNYLTMMSGDPQYFGIVDLDPTTAFFFPKDVDNLGNQMTVGGVKWRAYGEDMGSACNLTNNGNWACKHEPFLYFTDIQTGNCADTNVDYAGNFAGDLAGGTYKYMYIAPNLIDDGHDPSTDPPGALRASDAWAKKEIGKIMDSDVYKAGGVIFITWDEGEGRNGDSADQIPMIIVSPNIVSAGFKSSNAYSHKSYLATVEDILGLPRLATVASEPNMLEFLK